MRTLFLLMASMFLVVASVKAQDKIYRKNGEVLKVKILEISSTEIKYKIFGDENGPIYVLEKDRIQKIVYDNGRVEKPTLDIKDPEQYEDQLKKAIKINFLSPLFGYTQFSFEKSTGVGKSYELTMAIIGAGKNRTLDIYSYPPQTQKRDQFGIAVGAGYKFNKLPDFLFGRTRFTHIMQGAYAKPIFYLGNYGENVVVNKGGQTVVERQNVTFGAIQIELGKQWVFGDKFLLDLFWGFGIGADNKKEDYYDNQQANNYILQRLGTTPGFALNGGLKLGLLIK